MIDTLTVSRTLAETGLTTAQADAIAHAVQLAAEHGDHVTPDQFNAGIAALETRLVKQIHDTNLHLVKWMIGTVLAGAGMTVTVLRLLA